MLSILVAKLLNYIFRNRLAVLDPREKERKEYGIINFLSNLETALYLFAYALYIDAGFEFASMIVVLYPLRRYSCGLHFSKQLPCFAWTFTTLFGGFNVALAVNIGMASITFIFAICIYLNLRYAPKGSWTKPVLKKNISKYKEKTVTILILLYPVCLVLNSVIRVSQYSNIIVMAIIINTLNILPIFFKLFHIRERYI